jgi:hypothetical protein
MAHDVPPRDDRNSDILWTVNARTQAIPLGSAEFIPSLEKAMRRRLTLQERGPHEQLVADRRQGELTFNP